jgi:hypothetical protein
MTKQDESGGVSAAHRVLGAAIIGFEPNNVLDALAMIAAEVIVSRYPSHLRGKMLRMLDESVRRNCRTVEELLGSIGITGGPKDG